MGKLRDRMSVFRRPSEAATLPPSRLAGTSISAPEELPPTSFRSLSPRRRPPGSPYMSLSTLRGPPTVYGAEVLPDIRRELPISKPRFGDYDTEHFVIGGGVAIFHLATSRVVLCWHSRDHYWFLPKGRRDVNEESGTGAEREGFEESGYRNRLLPLPIAHRQPSAAGITAVLPPLPSASRAASAAPSPHVPPSVDGSRLDRSPPPPLPHSLPPQPLRASPLTVYSTEPLLTQLLPVTRTRQYLLHWYAAETLPPAAEARVNAAVEQTAQAKEVPEREVYVRPPVWPSGLTLRARVEQDWAQGASNGPGLGLEGVWGAADQKATVSSDDVPPTPSKYHPRPYEPLHHENTAVDAEEAMYQSELVPVEDAVRRLEGSGMEMVVRWAWQAICRRWGQEEEEEEQWSDRD